MQRVRLLGGVRRLEEGIGRTCGRHLAGILVVSNLR